MRNKNNNVEVGRDTSQSNHQKLSRNSFNKHHDLWSVTIIFMKISCQFPAHYAMRMTIVINGVAHLHTNKSNQILRFRLVVLARTSATEFNIFIVDLDTMLSLHLSLSMSNTRNKTNSSDKARR